MGDYTIKPLDQMPDVLGDYPGEMRMITCPMVILPGTRRPVLRVEDYVAYLEQHTYRNEQPRIQPPFTPVGGHAPTELAQRRRGGAR